MPIANYVVKKGRITPPINKRMNSLEHPTIELLAYFIYVAEGRPEGRALQHWLEAEEQFEVEEQFEAESGLEPNIFGDKAVEYQSIVIRILSADGS